MQNVTHTCLPAFGTVEQRLDYSSISSAGFPLTCTVIEFWMSWNWGGDEWKWSGFFATRENDMHHKLCDYIF